MPVIFTNNITLYVMQTEKQSYIT